MRLGDLVRFRRDLLFSGAVQTGWLESNLDLADKAARHFAFHGPAYHGVVRDPRQEQDLRPVDTATFTLGVVERITGNKVDEPFMLAIAGYGTGKSHLAVTLASLLGDPASPTASVILSNLAAADHQIGDRVRTLLSAKAKPFLVVAINGMQNFDLSGEIVRQVLRALRERGLDTSAVEDLRPRFRYAMNFTEAFFEALRDEYTGAFGACSMADVLNRLREQDEDAFQKVSTICERKIGSTLRAVGQESLHDFVRVTCQTYCGTGKPFAGLVILFDEFGRYLEFSVQRPQIAGPGALQQIFEAVQANAEEAFLLPLIQYDLRAYVSRVAPELQDDLQRYVSRYDVVPKARLSTNLETLIANLLEKQDPTVATKQVAARGEESTAVQSTLQTWYPEMAQHAVWSDLATFTRVVREGCWPLHPSATWLLYRLASVGRSLQQRSAVSLLADAYEAAENREVPAGFVISPTDLCSDGLVDEFLATERHGQQGAAAHAYRNVTEKYGHLFSGDEAKALRAVLLMAKTSPKLRSRDDCQQAMAMFCGESVEAVQNAVRTLEGERGAISWNEALHQYEIIGEAVPRAQFNAYLDGRLADIPAQRRARLFSENFSGWFQDLVTLPTDFGTSAQIYTKEWNYRVQFADVSLLPNQIDLAIKNWRDARGVDQAKGQLIYCYVGPDSDLAAVRSKAQQQMKACLEKAGGRWEGGAPVAICFLADVGGDFSAKVAEYWVLQNGIGPKEAQLYATYVADRRAVTRQELENHFEALRRQRQMAFATGQDVPLSHLIATLTELFSRVYPERIPFPFDGYATTQGNAAKDCAEFTRALFLGHLDREWIASRDQRRRNRAVQVLVESWQVLDGSGALRVIPGQPEVRKVVSALEKQLTERGQERPLVLGEALRAMCAPPIGCNLASAGLALGLLVGPRHDNLELLRHGQSIGFEPWLQDALPGNSFDLAVLDDTLLVRVSENAVSEWEVLLAEWDVEATHSGKIAFQQKAEELERRMPLPRALYDRLEILKSRTLESRTHLAQLNKTLEDAAEKLQGGIDRDDVSLISWAAAMLTGLRLRVDSDVDAWAPAQRKEVENNAAAARLQVQARFAAWLRAQRPAGIGGLEGYLRRMQRVAENLETLDLTRETRALEQHVGLVADNVRFLDRVQHLWEDVGNFTRRNKPTTSTPLSTLNGWVSTAEDYLETIQQASSRKVPIAQDSLDRVSEVLTEYVSGCKGQIERHRERLLAVYNASPASLEDLDQLRAEAMALQSVYAELEQDTSDLKAIIAQLRSVQEQAERLSQSNLDEAQLVASFERCIAETDSKFGRDEAPLDSEALYNAVMVTIRRNRQNLADDWMRHHLPQDTLIQEESAESAVRVLGNLRAAPGYLSSQQQRLVLEATVRCERRLDELEVEGLVARYNSLAESSKEQFLARIGVPMRGGECVM